MSLRKMFLEANAQNIKYVVLNDNKSMPELIPPGETEIRILVEAEDKNKLIKVFDLNPCYPILKERNEFFESNQAVYDSVKFRIIPKGKGYFPEQFETKLLIGRHIVNNCIYNPPLSEMVWIALYEFIHRGYRIKKRQLEIIKNRLDGYVGIVTYQDPSKKVSYDRNRIDLPDAGSIASDNVITEPITAESGSQT